MLIKLLPEELEDNWDLYYPLIENSLAPFIPMSEYYRTRIYHSILDETLVGWLVMKEDKVIALVTTTVYVEPITLSSHLLIYSLHGDGSMTNEIIKEGMSVLRKYAKEMGCDSIMAYSAVPSVVSMARSTGADIKFNLLNWSVR